MSLFQMMSSWRSRSTAEQMARQIAVSEWTKVWSKLSDQVWQMPKNERKGYIRARGALLIQQAVELALKERTPRYGSMTRVYALAMDQVVGLVAEHMATSRPQARSLRRAA